MGQDTEGGGAHTDDKEKKARDDMIIAHWPIHERNGGHQKREEQDGHDQAEWETNG